jgi:hypothetical protein
MKFEKEIIVQLLNMIIGKVMLYEIVKTVPCKG